MPWQETDPMRERVQFIALYQTGLYTMSELCARFGISRKTGYKWVARYEQEGPAGLQERSHAPHHCPHRMVPEIERVLLAAKQMHPSWGARKILPYVARRRPELALPAASTVWALFQREGLCRRRRRRSLYSHPGAVPLQTSAANEVWSADFKGEFRLGNGQECYPLTVCDAHTRYLLGCAGLLSTKQAGAFPVFERLFRQYGLPEAIRTDNGVPFATRAICGLSKLNVWWMKLGIGHQRIEPARPNQNGRHERMHRTLKAEATRPAEKNLAAQQQRFDRFRAEYNEVRPHEALGHCTPAERYQPSGRRLPKRVPKPEYPAHCTVRYVCNAGTFRFKNHQPFVSLTLAGEPIALEEVEDGVWSIYFCNVLLARLDERTFTLRS